MAIRAKNRKSFKRQLLQYPWADFIQISYDNPLRKQLKQFCSHEQNGHQS